VQAAKDLDVLMGQMIPDLRAISAPPDLSRAHAGFIGSLESMAGACTTFPRRFKRAGLTAMAAAAAIGAAWQQGSSDRSTLEQALGFSLSG